MKVVFDFVPYVEQKLQITIPRGMVSPVFGPYSTGEFWTEYVHCDSFRWYCPQETDKEFSIFSTLRQLRCDDNQWAFE